MSLTATIKTHAPKKVKHVARLPERTWRRMTAERRAMPAFIILGAQRAGTTSLYRWLCAHPDVMPAWQKEIHYFDVEYRRGMSWYQSYFPFPRAGKITGEASPYMLPHAPSAERAKRDLPESTKFIIQLREPVERAISHYFLERRIGLEPETFERAIALEPERLKGSEARVAKGLFDYNHRHYSYTRRGEYAPQVRRWFDVIGRDRILVLESERLQSDPVVCASVLEWLGLSPNPTPLPSLNAARRTDGTDQGVIEQLAEHFKPFNEELFELLGTRLWESDYDRAGG
ncbi:MAG TPA: sulfotransferase domain-containing protein [Acidimicrobiales bacterium]|nr:sulfotransferase domain-containing protein [Acidimicrobiales bacterium]